MPDFQRLLDLPGLLRRKSFFLFGVVQGEAGPDEFRTAPLWGLGQRIFLLHDGRTTDLAEAIRAHRSVSNGRFRASEANDVIDRFNRLAEKDKQDLYNFLRSL